MDFTPTEEQQLLRETARTLLAKECPTALIRACVDDPSAADPLWKHLREWVALADGPLVDLCIFVEETGAVIAPGPFLPTTALFVPLVRALGHDLAEAALAGEVTGTVAVAGSDGVWLPNADPVKTFVPEAERADVVAVVHDGAVVLAERAPARHLPTLDLSRRLAQVDVASVTGVRLALDATAIADVLERAVVALSAEMVGTARWVFEQTLAYAKVREQFGRPIGSFQALKHKLADMKVELERAWSAVYYAAMAIDAGDADRHRAAHAAKAAAGAAVNRNAKDGMQIHGGIGYTWDHDLHLFIRRGLTSERLLGTTEWHLDRLADLLF